MKKYCIYIHKNKINNKIYVGQTCKNVWGRWGLNGQQYCYSENNKFGKAIKKYGFENFDHIIIKENLSKEEANELEKQLIVFYDSFKNGYNSTTGGDGGGFIGHKHKKDSIIKMVKKGKENGMYGKKRPQYVKDAVRKSHAKPIEQYDLNGNFLRRYESATYIKKNYNYDNSLINKCCKNNKAAYGFFWKYADK